LFFATPGCVLSVATAFFHVSSIAAARCAALSAESTWCFPHLIAGLYIFQIDVYGLNGKLMQSCAAGAADGLVPGTKALANGSFLIMMTNGKMALAAKFYKNQR
jgi:hypothetical protein